MNPADSLTRVIAQLKFDETHRHEVYLRFMSSLFYTAVFGGLLGVMDEKNGLSGYTIDELDTVGVVFGWRDGEHSADITVSRLPDGDTVVRFSESIVKANGLDSTGEYKIAVSVGSTYLIQAYARDFVHVCHMLCEVVRLKSREQPTP